MMGLLCDRQILALADQDEMISPFLTKQMGRDHGKISYGVSSFGYDARLARRFRVFSPPPVRDFERIINPKEFDDGFLTDEEGEFCVIPHGGYALGSTIEHFKMPDDVLAICLGKSTYARCGIIVNVTPLEPGWQGNVTIEISNSTPCPVKVYAGEGICQFLFFRGYQPTVSYATRKGKYQDQAGVTTARL